MDDPAKCVVLVPVGGGGLVSDCDAGLRELEKLGYPVRRVYGYADIAAARSQMATDALADGFEELMWVDADVAFDPADVGRLRGHGLPFACGLYPKKGKREFAAALLPGTQILRFGRQGGLVQILYCGFGFAHTRAEVYHRAARVGDLPGCNRGFRENLVPYFAPLVAADERGDPWYLGEDYAFCERARRAGVSIYADTTVRLWHVGAYRYGWEDAGREVERFADYTFRLSTPAVGPAPLPAAPPPAAGYTEDWFSRHIPLWTEMLAPLVGTPCRVLEVGVFEGRSTAWLMEHILTHPDARLTWVDTFAGGREHAGLDLGGLEGRFRANTARWAGKMDGHVGRSQEVLRRLDPAVPYDFVSIDGSHEAADVLADAVLCWPLVKPGGLLCFDDYGWWTDPAPERSPKLAIDTFMSVYKKLIRVAVVSHQVFVVKL